MKKGKFGGKKLKVREAGTTATVLVWILTQQPALKKLLEVKNTGLLTFYNVACMLLFALRSFSLKIGQGFPTWGNSP